MCSGWMKFENFFGDVGEPPDGKSIDRINNDGNYSCGHCAQCNEMGWPSNCRWATPSEQIRNSSSARILSFDGKVMSIAEWAIHLNFPARVLYDRINGLNWSVEKTLTTPRRILQKKRRTQEA